MAAVQVSYVNNVSDDEDKISLIIKHGSMVFIAHEPFHNHSIAEWKKLLVGGPTAYGQDLYHGNGAGGISADGDDIILVAGSSGAGCGVTVGCRFSRKEFSAPLEAALALATRDEKARREALAITRRELAQTRVALDSALAKLAAAEAASKPK